ncbi:MAG: PaaI family thioesterase [Candidatus Eremiobacteraeota bacterium]|nr:PaaI family thioesterase [Candidatus Eremiobacteraeota bacterium]
MKREVPIDDGRCFACGPENPIGLRLRFETLDEAHVRAEIVLATDFAGWKGIAHGGIAMALLDEGMAHAAAAAGFRGMTGSMNVRFRAPVPLERTLAVTGEVRWIRRNVLGLHAEVREDERLLVEGDGNFVAKGRLDEASDRRSAPA